VLWQLLPQPLLLECPPEKQIRIQKVAPEKSFTGKQKNGNNSTRPADREPHLSVRIIILSSKKKDLSRRQVLKLFAGAGGMAALAMDAPAAVIKISNKQAPKAAYPGSERIRTICTHCAVGCGIVAEVQKGVWLRQQPSTDHPISQGAQCCKGAAAIDIVKSEKRLKFPMKKKNGKWQRISWDQAMTEISTKLLALRKEHGPDAVMWMGSAKVSTEMAYLQRKLAAFWGTNNIDHQARICHSTTVAGVANTWGYGALTIGYTGQTPERIRKHTNNWGSFGVDDLKARDDTSCAGEYYGLPWPCWNTDHPGTPILYDISKPVSQGGLPFRNRFGLQHNGISQLAAAGSANPGARVHGGYAEFSANSFEKLGIELSEAEKS